MRFEIGNIYITRGAKEEIAEEDIIKSLNRYTSCDWGELCKEDRQANEDALKYGDRLFAVYKDSKGKKFYIITEWDRSVTTILLPSEY